MTAADGPDHRARHVDARQFAPVHSGDLLIILGASLAALLLLETTKRLWQRRLLD